MNEIVDRVAKAITAKIIEDFMGSAVLDGTDIMVEEANRGVDCVELARLAIAAMREPTEQMIDAAGETCLLRIEDAAEVWRTMNDEALK